MLNNFDVTSVHVDKGTLLFVVGLPAGEAGLQESNGVCELSSVSGVLSSVEALGLGLVEFTFITFIQLFLEVEDLVLECELVDLVLGLEGEDLIVGVLAEALAIVSLLVKLLDVINILVDFTVVTFVDSGLVSELLAPNVDVLSQGLVLGLQVVQSDEGLVTSVFEELDLMLVL